MSLNYYVLTGQAVAVVVRDQGGADSAHSFGTDPGGDPWRSSELGRGLQVAVVRAPLPLRRGPAGARRGTAGRRVVATSCFTGRRSMVKYVDARTFFCAADPNPKIHDRRQFCAGLKLVSGRCDEFNGG